MRKSEPCSGFGRLNSQFNYKIKQQLIKFLFFFQAEKKGATATEYGLVFGVFELVVFIISPVYGKYLNRIGPKVLFNAGIFTTGTCAILFG